MAHIPTRLHQFLISSFQDFVRAAKQTHTQTDRRCRKEYLLAGNDIWPCTSSVAVHWDLPNWLLAVTVYCPASAAVAEIMVSVYWPLSTTDSMITRSLLDSSTSSFDLGWHSFSGVNGVGRINDVNQHRVRLVLKWVTAFGRVNRLDI